MKIIITGTTGMVGEGVLIECLAHSQVTEVLSVSRKATGYTHPKLKEYLVSDFLSLKKNDEKLKGYDACFFCAGVSRFGMNETDFTKFTYDTTLNFAKAVINPQMTFIYVSGASTDSTEKGRLMWARVKGKTENDLMKQPFKQVFAFRPAAMQPTKGQTKSWWASYTYTKYLNWLYPILKVVYPNGVNTLRQVGNAMIEAAQNGYEKNVVEVKDITILAKRQE